jgi:hypothetical protein
VTTALRKVKDLPFEVRRAWVGGSLVLLPTAAPGTGRAHQALAHACHPATLSR